MKVKILEYSVDNVFPKWPVPHKMVINTLNPHSYCEAIKDFEFKDALKASDILIPDGIGIVLAAKVLNKVKINRIAGADMHQHLLELAESKKLKVFYLGASNNTLKKIEIRISKEYPSIRVKSFSPPYKISFSNKESLKMIEEVNKFSPDILFVGMTAPKQEKWVYSYKDNLSVEIVVSIGAVFDFYGGTVKRAPKWMIEIGFEWLYRLIREPQRMWKRYLINNSKFVWYVLIEKLRLIKL